MKANDLVEGPAVVDGLLDAMHRPLSGLFPLDHGCQCIARIVTNICHLENKNASFHTSWSRCRSLPKRT